MSGRTYRHHYQTGAEVNAAPAALFAELDDHARLSAHMVRSSAMMAGSAMRFDFDAARGQAVGATIRMSGRMLGLSLHVEEVVTERVVPERKVWETVSVPRLLVIGGYRMGFSIRATPAGAWLTLFIDYDDPPGAWGPIGRLLGPLYARWCSDNMVKAAVERFG